MIENPWLVESIQDFYFLKCPECSFDTQQEIIFQQHSIENHPLSYVFFQTKIEDAAYPFEGFKIKQEPAELVETSYDIKQETTNDNYDYYDYVERDIKNEFVDANEQPNYDHNIKPKKRQRIYKCALRFLIFLIKPYKGHGAKFCCIHKTTETFILLKFSQEIC